MAGIVNRESSLRLSRDHPSQPRRAAQLQAIEWPGKLRILAEVIASFEPETVAVTFLASDAMQRYAVSEEDLRSALSRIPGVKL
jgi:hypothetical protein